MLEILQLLKYKLKSFRLTPFPIIMLTLITIRTFASGNSVLLTGLCVGFLPFFSQFQTTTCLAEDVSEEKDMLICYLLHYLIVIIGLAYLYFLTYLGSHFYPNYVINPLLKETFWLAATCNMVFVNLVVPLTFSSNQLQRLMVAITSVLAEIGFMYLMTMLLKAAGSNFILPLPGIIIFIVILSITTLEFICLQVYSKKKKC